MRSFSWSLRLTTCLVLASKIGGERFKSVDCAPEPESGPCRGLVERWFYNKTTEMCDMFYWGGCRGNENNFPNCTVCMQKCSCEEERNATELEDLCKAIEEEADQKYWDALESYDIEDDSNEIDYNSSSLSYETTEKPNDPYD